MSSDSPDLELIPDNRRDLLGRWLATCRSDDFDERPFAHLWEESTTREELEILLSPFAEADELLRRLTQFWGGPGEPVDDAAVIEAAGEHLAEMVSNALLLGEDELADQARSAPAFTLIDEDDVPHRDEWIDAEIAMQVSEAQVDAASSQDDPAIAALLHIVSEWLPNPDMSAHVMSPLLDLDVDLSAFHRLWSIGALVRVGSEAAFVYRYARRTSSPPMRRSILKDRDAKAADRAGVDWRDLPTEPAAVELLAGAAEAGHYPSIAKLSLMTMAGVGVPSDLPRAFGLLDRAAGDFESVVACYRAGQQSKTFAGAAHYGLRHLHDHGWGLAQSDALAAEHLRKSAEAGFPTAMYVLGLSRRSWSKVEIGLPEAESWLLKAAAAGVVAAYGALYHLYAGDLEDPAKAFEWLVRAADEDGWADHQRALGRAYDLGEGTEPNGILAVKWYYLAAYQSERVRPFRIEDLERLAARMDPAEVDEGRSLALVWIEERSIGTRFELPDGGLRDPLANHDTGP